MPDDVVRSAEVAVPEPDEIGRFAERLGRFEGHGELVGRGRAATGFSAEVVRVVVDDHLGQREQIARELAELYPTLEALQTSLVRDRDRQRSEAESVVFRLDEIELRR